MLFSLRLPPFPRILSAGFHYYALKKRVSMTRYPRFSLIFAFCFLLLPQVCFSSDLIRKEMPSGKFKREYFLHVPSGYRPVVFVFHGGGGHAEQITEFSGFNKLSETYGFLAVYPESINKHWNDGGESKQF